MVKASNRKKNRWLLAVLTLAVGLIAVMATPAGANHGDAVGTGGGNIHVTYSGTASTTHVCADLTATARSGILDPNNPNEPDPYVGTYTAFDQNGVAHTYTGPLSTYLTYESHENPLGTYANSTCNPATLGAAARPVTGWLRDATTGGSLLDCNYTDGSYRRVGTNIAINLKGTCKVADTAGQATVDTHEQRTGEGYYVNFCDNNNPPSCAPPPKDGKWAETYLAPAPDDPLP